MDKIISWLMDVETSAHILYYEGSNYFKENAKLSEFLLDLSADETFHSKTVKSLNDYMANNRIKVASDIKVDDNLKKKILNPFTYKLELLHNKTLTERDMYSCLIESEFSEWNDIFIYVINSIAKQKVQLQIIPSKIQKHLSKLEHYFNSDDRLKAYYLELRKIPRLWENNILVVDDDKTIRDFLHAVLGRRYSHIELAENGEEAYRLYENNYYDLVLCDIDMPVMTGVEFYNKIRLLEHFENDSFVFLTGNPQNTFFDDNKLKYVMKPFSVQHLLDEVERILV